MMYVCHPSCVHKRNDCGGKDFSANEFDFGCRCPVRIYFINEVQLALIALNRYQMNAVKHREAPRENNSESHVRQL